MGQRTGPFSAFGLVALGLVARAPGRVDAGGSRPTVEVQRPVVLGRFSTSYTKDADHKSRAFNVEFAAEAVDGRVVGPGSTFSFNEAVGERTAAYGFAKSAVIRDRMMAEGMGGGTCQVASTLYAAALLAGLDVVARAPHTRPSAYIRMGFDATVAFPKIDLKLANPTAVPVVIRARSGKGVLEVWFDARGVSKPDVSLTSDILERLPFERVIKRDRALAGDAVRLTAFGIPGYRVQRTREIRTADGGVRRDVRVDLYPPTGEVIEVAPSFDAARLTAAPDGPGETAESGGRPAIAVDPAAVRPVLVQVRPSARVRLDNAGPSDASSALKASDEP